MFLNSIEDVISVLREKLPDYLIKKNLIDVPTKKFCCPFHNEKSPSMGLIPKTNNEIAHCFGCQINADIFKFAAHLDGLPESGPEWIKETLPALAKMFNVEISLAPPSSEDLLKNKLYALARAIADYIQVPNFAAVNYMKERNWVNDHEDCYSVDYKLLIEHLLDNGWEKSFINMSKLISIGENNYPIVGEGKYTWIIRDARKRPIAFISRTTSNNEAKYLHSAESLIFLKREVLIGLDLALTEAKKSGLYIVEGTGDRFAMLNKGIVNVASLCGAAITEFHLHNLKSLGIKDLFFCLDWDEAGQTAIERMIKIMTAKSIVGFNIKIVTNNYSEYKDIDEYLKVNESIEMLPHLDLFDWLMDRTDLINPDDIQQKLITAIAATPSAIKREILAKKLSNKTGIFVASIISDVERIQNKTWEYRKERLLSAANKYVALVEQDPTNIISAISQHEKEVADIEATYGKETTGAGYQLSRFDALEQIKLDTSIDMTGFNLGVYHLIAQSFSNGLSWATGALIYLGGRANASKTGVGLAIALDILINDPDTVVILHFTDDSLQFTSPRIITNIAYISTGKRVLTIGEANNPNKGFKTPESENLYKQSVELLRSFLSNERLILLDGENGSNLSTLEKSVKYIKRKYPNKKLFALCDGTHNYSDYPELEPTNRIGRIMEAQKNMAVKYGMCVMSTAEYRKSGQAGENSTKIRLPKNDDIADSRKGEFRAGAIIHVYNDINDRGEENADIFWCKPNVNKKLPRLMLVYGKNKLTSFKGKIFVDIDPDTLTLKEVPTNVAIKDADSSVNGTMQLINGKVTSEAMDYDEDIDD